MLSGNTKVPLGFILTVATPFVLGAVWLANLQFSVAANTNDITEQKLSIKQVKDQTQQILISLARIEGSLGVDSELKKLLAKDDEKEK